MSAAENFRWQQLARRLFIPAALFNCSVAFGLVFLRPWLSPLLDLAPAEGTNLSFLYLGAALITTFGGAYWLVSLDHVRYRPYIGLGVVGKSLVVVGVYLPWLLGQASWQLPALAVGDIVFAALFVAFLRRTRAA